MSSENPQPESPLSSEMANLPVIPGENGAMSRVYAIIGNQAHGCKSCISTAGYNGGVPSCHDSAVGEYNNGGELIREGCGYRCCKIEPDATAGAGNSIIVESGELDSSKKQDHLVVVGEHAGVQLVECTTGQCDGEVDVKPLDCKRYPFLPVIEGNMLRFQHGVRTKCPMPETDRVLHLAYVITSVLESLKNNPASRKVFEHGHEKMVGYEDFDIQFLNEKTLADIDSEASSEIAEQIKREKIRISLFASPEDEQDELLNKYRDDLLAMTQMNLANFELLQKAGVEFTDRGINLEKINWEMIATH